ncbi:tobamovirus multiplication protein 1 isoform X1 [Rosa rugosa]|uniref:tobamovirus multiplication protein 1 isoform X1 n=1 Tax=Rosa rugosa TaxID=74645 RepID=UPI002B407796|nr:tobamovirus multiplication protein 1 isoform X1 [Rosa rugosa]
MMLLESILEKGCCFRLDLPLFILNIALAVFNGVLAAIAFSQLVRIHLRNQQIGWTRQKVLHLMIGCSNLGYFLYFTSTLIATFEQWFCWSNVCGFILMAYPKILLLAAFLLVLSFWVDLCHQANDEEDDDDDDDSSMQHALLENSKNKHRSSVTNGHRICCSFPSIHVGSHQKFVIAVVGFVLILMMSFSVVIWIGAGKNPIDSSAAAEVYEDLLAFVVLFLGGGLGCYGILLLRKLRKVRSEKASSEMWKVGGLAVASVVCFTSSALVALLTDIPLYEPWRLKKAYGGKALVFLMLYYFIGSWVPSAFVLWFMRELPPPITNRQREQSRTITFISYAGVGRQHPRHWATVTSSNNQASRASPI